MIYTSMTIKAMKLAYAAHNGQFDHNGVPYIFHPYHLAEQMEDEFSCTVALLHDVVEDTEVTMEELQKEFPQEVIDALTLLTHSKDTEYYDYVRAIKTNPLAMKVKLEDLRHNSDESRIVDSDVTEQQLEYWRNKYSKAKAILLEAQI